MSKRTRKQAPVSPVRTRSPRRSSVGWLILSVGIGGLTLTGLALLWRSANEAPIAETLPNALDTTAVSQAASSAETTTSDIAALPGLDAQRFDSVVRSVAEREDPTIDGWESGCPQSSRRASRPCNRK